MAGPLQHTRLIAQGQTAQISTDWGLYTWALPCSTTPVYPADDPDAFGQILPRWAGPVTVVLRVYADVKITGITSSTGVTWTLDRRLNLHLPDFGDPAEGYLDIWSAQLSRGQQLDSRAGDYLRVRFTGGMGSRTIGVTFGAMLTAHEYAGLYYPSAWADVGAAQTSPLSPPSLTFDSGAAVLSSDGELFCGAALGVTFSTDRLYLASLPSAWTSVLDTYGGPPGDLHQTSSLGGTQTFMAADAGITNWPLPRGSHDFMGLLGDFGTAGPTAWGALLQAYLPDRRLIGKAPDGTGIQSVAVLAERDGGRLRGALVSVANIVGTLSNPLNMETQPLVAVARLTGTLGRTFQGTLVAVARIGGKLSMVPSFPPVAMVSATRTAGAMVFLRGSLTSVAKITGNLGPAFIPLLCPYGLFCRLAKIVNLIQAINRHRGSDEAARVALIYADYDNFQDNLVDQLYSQLGRDQTARGTFVKQLQALAKNVLVTMANASVPLPALTLANALEELIRQLRLKGHYVLLSTVGTGWLPAKNPEANVGNAVLVLSVRDDEGRILEDAFAEHLTVTCTADAQRSGTAGQESLKVESELDEADELNFDWPQGSGASVSLTATDEGDGNKIRGNSLVKYGGFDTVDPNAPGQPLGWITVYGGWGPLPTDRLYLDAGYLADGITAAAYKYAFGLRITGQTGDDKVLLPDDPLGIQIGHPPVEIRIAFPRNTLRPLTTYGLNLWLAADGAAGVNAGTVEVALVSPTKGTQPTRALPWLQATEDESGNPNAITADLATWPTTYAPLSGSFRTPRQLAGDEMLAIRVTGALPDGRHAWLDSLTVRAMTQLYPGGPFLMVVAGSAAMIAGDAWTIQVTNDRAGRWQEAFERLFGMRQLGLLLPSAAPAEADLSVPLWTSLLAPDAGSADIPESYIEP